ncbi:MAG: hypothetical protein R2838_11360 [Caldilineaceae bacterium]
MRGRGHVADVSRHVDHPEGVEALLILRNAWPMPALAADAVDYVSAHLRPPAGDIGELLALRDLLSDSLPRVNISATKSMTGPSAGCGRGGGVHRLHPGRA